MIQRLDRETVPMVTATKQTDKQKLIERVQQFPDSATWAEMADELALIAALRKSIEASDANEVVSNEEAKRRSAQCLQK